MSQRPSVYLSFFLTSILLIWACRSVPITGRKQLNFIGSDELLQTSFSQYEEVLENSSLSSDMEQVNKVRTVGNRIKNAVEQYMKDAGLEKELEGYAWEFNLIESDQVNAWCMPGGKVAFYTGIMPICQDEEGIAVVMGHEVAHAIAEHGAERMSQQLLQQAGAVTLAVAMHDKPAETQALWMAAYGVGTQVGAMLPFSRQHESEADHLGLIFMAMAGYDPNEAPEFWERMAAGGGGAPPEFLSTHPSHETRINNLKGWIPEAMKYYQPR
ncbi:MAG: M48 family metallopeptidase [Bacteroidota bacterium]|nr:M48 family metallopeptidase [Bacteroidota bacterium]MDX5447091.1 M48 family metallopeptidase [Bacteroidota bacterium]MDX5504614.1 M48 family metallopeptidase [Bacteroidota bacterium]